jgi:hypothetical protein
MNPGRSASPWSVVSDAGRIRPDVPPAGDRARPKLAATLPREDGFSSIIVIPSGGAPFILDCQREYAMTSRRIIVAVGSVPADQFEAIGHVTGTDCIHDKRHDQLPLSGPATVFMGSSRASWEAEWGKLVHAPAVRRRNSAKRWAKPPSLLLSFGRVHAKATDEILHQGAYRNSRH